ncbi:unnamed protein product [Ostreobium quekettii]|uniref:Protein kinase domain-containing protein n=1 Tax=Ostreobium quekettii TaxID=121088 RepID=A0A8S1J8P8_9CHLO|nr:unnamed protein product [Ostreobium quekettii]|eukprot:evm.model.scf_211.3 EVM.evm.TU.scf_211.3   scf_211:34227-34883(-)
MGNVCCPMKKAGPDTLGQDPLTPGPMDEASHTPLINGDNPSLVQLEPHRHRFCRNRGAKRTQIDYLISRGVCPPPDAGEQGGGLPDGQDGRRSAPRRWAKGHAVAEGAFGQVFVGLDLDTGQPIAIKQVKNSNRTAANTPRYWRNCITENGAILVGARLHLKLHRKVIGLLARIVPLRLCWSVNHGFGSFPPIHGSEGIAPSCRCSSLSGPPRNRGIG